MISNMQTADLVFIGIIVFQALALTIYCLAVNHYDAGTLVAHPVARFTFGAYMVCAFWYLYAGSYWWIPALITVDHVLGLLHALHDRQEGVHGYVSPVGRNVYTVVSVLTVMLAGVLWWHQR